MSFPENLPSGWKKILAAEKDKPYFRDLVAFLNAERRSGQRVFPESRHILRALQELDFDAVRVVILGQDPYHGPGQAIGRSFAVPNDLKPKPPSLLNIFKEISRDLKVSLDTQKTDLSGWAAQGVLLLNSVLTVRAGQAFGKFLRIACWRCSDSGLLPRPFYSGARRRRKRKSFSRVEATSFLNPLIRRHFRLTEGFWATAISRKPIFGSSLRDGSPSTGLAPWSWHPPCFRRTK